MPGFLNSHGANCGAVWTVTFLLQHVEDSFPLTKGLRPEPTTDSTAAAQGQPGGERSSLRQPRSAGVTPRRLLLVPSKDSDPVRRKDVRYAKASRLRWGLRFSSYSECWGHLKLNVELTYRNKTSSNCPMWTLKHGLTK